MITLRLASADDVAGLEDLARLDSARPPTGPVLLSEEDGQVRAAIELESGRVMADPFAPTAHLVALLREHRARRTAPPAALRGRRLLPRLALRAG